MSNLKKYGDKKPPAKPAPKRKRGSTTQSGEKSVTPIQLPEPQSSE
jgi:hypothetical protein